MEFNDVRLRYENLSGAIDEALREVLRSGRYILGPSVQALEREFSQYCGATEAVAVGSGTDALSIALRAIHVGPGDEVMVPAVSAAATAMAVVLAGARPVFVDISPEDFNIDPVLCGERRGARVKAVIPVHLYGMPARLDEVSRAGMPIIEDAAQAHGSESSWGRCGSFGIAAAFSFYPTKNIGAYGDGGMLVTSDTGIAVQARLLRNYGQRENYHSEIPGQNSRLDELQAAILQIQLRKLDEWNLSRRRIARLYREAFEGLPLGMQSETGRSNYHLFVVTTPQRDKLLSYLLSQGIPALVHYPVPLNRQKAFLQFNPEACPNAELLCSRVLSLPLHPFLSDEDAERVAESVCRFFK